MSHNPLVSVIVPVYNGSRFLKKTIDSILAQTYTNLEIIIIDDASTDNSKDIIDAYDDCRIIKSYNEKNLNMCGTSNRGFQMMTGEYCAITGHDDVWHPDKIEKQIAYLESNKHCGVCFSRCDVIDHTGEHINEKNEFYNLFNSFKSKNRFEDFRVLYMQGNKLCAPSAVVRTEVLNKIGGYDYSLLQLQDYELWLRILTISDMYILEEHLVDYRQILDSNTNLGASNKASDVRFIHEMYYIRDKILYDLKDDFFIKSMSSLFKKPDARDFKELLCERMFLLKALKNPYWNKRAIELLNQKDTRTIAESQYEFSLQVFYKDNSEIVFTEPGCVKYIKENETPKIDSRKFLEYLEICITSGNIEASKNLFEDLKNRSMLNSEIATMDIIYKIYNLEKQMNEESFFNNRGSVSKVIQCYDNLKFLLRRFEFIEQNDEKDFVKFVIDNRISSSAIILCTEFSIMDKEKVLNDAALALYDCGQVLLALRLLNCAYRSFESDITKYNLAYILCNSGNNELALQVIEQIKTVNDKVLALKSKIQKNK